MVFETALPELGLQKKKHSKDLIISILSKEWPLSVKEIHARLKKEYSLEASYQAVHKAIIELENENILSKQGKVYALNKNWITNLKNFASDLEKNYFDTSGKYEVDPNYEGTITFKFDDFSIFCVTIADIFCKQSLIGKSKPILTGVLNHGLWPLRFSFSDFTLLYKGIQGNTSSWCIVKNTLPFDKWVTEQYRVVGFNQISGHCPEGYDNKLIDIATYGDSVMKFCFTKESMENLERIYSKIHGIKDLFRFYAEGIPDKDKIPVITKFTKDPELASVLREQMINYFKEHKK